MAKQIQVSAVVNLSCERMSYTHTQSQE